MYPSPGRRLVPRLLAPIIGDVAVRSAIAKAAGLPADSVLRTLDEKVWRGRTSETVRKLAREVVRHVDDVVIRQVGTATVFADEPALDELDVAPRTRNALSHGGLVKDGHLTSTTVSYLWHLRNFGAVSLLDLLIALEARGPREVASATPGSRATRSRAVEAAGRTLARRRWSSSVTVHDPRVGAALLAVDPFSTTAREAGESLAALLFTPPEAKATARAIRQFTADIDRRRKLPLEEELDEVIRSLTTRENERLALVARTGMGGDEPVTLDDAGRLVGITRERVRQLEKRFKERIAECAHIWTPTLDRALEEVERMLPATLESVEAELLRAGIIGRRFSIMSLMAAAETLGKSLPFSVRDEVVVPEGEWAPTSAVRTAARRLVEHWGVTTLADLGQRLQEQGYQIDSRMLSIMAVAIEGFEWLDAERGWFWIRGTRNRLLNQVRKIISVAGSIGLSELREGVGRHHRMNGFRPPREVLAALCVSSGDYARNGDVVFGLSGLADWREVLGDNERLLAQTLFDFGPLMRREDLENVVVRERGLKRSSFYIYLTYSPIIERFAPGVYGLRGAPVTAAEVDALIPPRVRHQVLQDHGWDGEGRLWAAFRISPAVEQTGILGAPAAVRSVASGPYELFTEDDQPVGTLVVQQNMWGVAHFFRRWGVERGDVIVITFDLPQRRATITAGSNELLLRYQAGE